MCKLSFAKIAQKNRISATKTNLFVLMSERFLSNLKTIQNRYLFLLPKFDDIIAEVSQVFNLLSVNERTSRQAATLAYSIVYKEFVS